jgi:hypothetical protein
VPALYNTSARTTTLCAAFSEAVQRTYTHRVLRRRSSSSSSRAPAHW